MYNCCRHYFDCIWRLLCEIKCEIKNNGNETACAIRSTGPAIRSAGVGNLYVKVQNDTNQTQPVLIEVRNLEDCPKTVADDATIEIPANCAQLTTFDIGPSGLDLQEFEVRITSLNGLSTGLQAFVAGAQGNSFNLEAANTWRDSELVCKPE